MAAQETLLNGRYRLLAQLGSGGMAVIYKAQDLALGRIVAVKILRPSLTGDASFLTRFRQEARNVANLAHPNIVTLYDVGQDGNTYYMVMEFVDGKDLKKLIRESAPFTVERALHIAIQICAGVGYAHRAGLVHADVKPQNALITNDDQVKVTDFGIAQALSNSQPQERQSVVWGSPHYFAPEQASGETPSPAADVYAIGIVMFEMLTGKLPYNGNDQQELALAHIREEVPHVMNFNPNVPQNLDAIIYKVMSKEPANRYRMADQLGRILISYQKQGHQATSNAAPLQPSVQSQPQPPAQTPSSTAATARPGQFPTIPSGRAAPSVPAGGGQPHPTVPPQPVYPDYPPVQQKPQQPYAPNYGQASVAQTVPLSSQTPQGGYAANYNGYGPSQGSYPTIGSQSSYDSTPPPMQADMPDYQVTAPPAPIDLVTIVLGILAFLGVIGLFPLWLSVLDRWLPK